MREYSAALFHEFRLLFKVHRERGFSIIQACNPPDLIFLAALPFKLMGKRFIYDQHDVSPELFVVKFGNKGFLYRALMFFERMSYAMADQVITANATFKDIAISRGGKTPSQVEVVYGVPDRKRIRRVEPEPGLHGGRKFVLGYVGIINEQDGVDHLVRAVAHLVKVEGFRDFRAVVVGSGPALELVRALARSLEVEDFILFSGYLKGEKLLAYLSAFDIGIIPDPFNEANDLMSMNKVFEYCALGIPTACYPLKETSGSSATRASMRRPMTRGLAEACLKLMQDEALRARSAATAAQAFGGEVFSGRTRLANMLRPMSAFCLRRPTSIEKVDLAAVRAKACERPANANPRTMFTRVNDFRDLSALLCNFFRAHILRPPRISGRPTTRGRPRSCSF